VAPPSGRHPGADAETAPSDANGTPPLEFDTQPRDPSAARPGCFTGLRQAAAAARGFAFATALLILMRFWTAQEAELLGGSVVFLIASSFVLSFFGLWAVISLGGLLGWLSGRRRDRPREGAAGGALGCWLSLVVVALMVHALSHLPLLTIPLLLLGPWVGARWLGPLASRTWEWMERLPFRFNVWAGRHLVLRRPRLDLRGRILGGVGGFLAWLVCGLPVMQYLEAGVLAARLSARIPSLHTPMGPITWQRLFEARRHPAPGAPPRFAVVEMDPSVLRRLLTRSSEAALNAAALKQLHRWQPEHVVVPITLALPRREELTAKHQMWPLPWLQRPPLTDSALRRMHADLPALLARLRATPEALLCPVSTPAWSQQPTAGALFQPLLQGAPRVGSAHFDLYQVRQLPTLHARDELGRPALPLLLTRPRVSSSRHALGPPAASADWPPETPTVGPGEVLMSYTGSGPAVTVPHLTYGALMAGEPIYEPDTGEWTPPARFFRGRIVLLDTLYQPSFDTPIGRLTATELLIVATQNLLQHRFLAPWSPPAQLLAAWICGAVVGRLSLGRSPLQGFLRLTGILVVYLLVAFGLFFYPGSWLPVLPVILAGLLAFLLVHQFVFVVDEQELQQQRRRQAEHERELTVSREIQTSLMPEPVTPAGAFIVLTRSEPAREVGGDFCSVFPLGEGGSRLGIALGDVSGKGIQGAMYMTVATTLLEARAAPETAPAQVLADANLRLYPKMRRRRMFVSAIYGVLDSAAGVWTYASAGQVPPLHLGAEVRYLPAAGVPLGALRAASYSDSQVSLAPGESLLLASDGFVEARNHLGQVLGYDGFREMVRRQLPCPPSALLEALFDALRRHLGPRQAQDDLTLLLIHRRG
jgi:serine phosphatase RsbU (regulator of sigma subunit)/CHASE2 domain-containing sensor protein